MLRNPELITNANSSSSQASAHRPDPELASAFPEAAEALPLQEAYRQSADPDLLTKLWNKNDQLKREGRWCYIGTPQKVEGLVLSEFDTHGKRLQEETRRLVVTITAHFLQKLCRGDLTAWAREGSPLAPYREIPKAAWTSLGLGDPASGIVRGPGVDLFEVYVGVRMIAPEPLIEAGAPGRPSAAHLVLAEFDRRIESGQVCDTLRAQARTLAAWLKQTHPKAPPLASRRTEEVIRAAYNEWKARRAGGEPQT